MDLPTCPSCGQSVLDDEPVLCPFCGAAMDGSSGPTKDPAPRQQKQPATPAQKKNPSAKPSESATVAGGKDLDPFDIAASPQARRAIACAPKRTKSRPMPVQCPMCDTKGYVPRSAAGKQVKCWNRECMVPLFNAPVPDGTRKPGTSGPVSEQAVAQEERLKTPASSRRPIVMYGVIGSILLTAGVGLKFYLDAEPNLDHLNQPISIAPISDVDVEQSAVSSETPDSETTAFSEAESSSGIIGRLASEIVNAARVSTNRDKALCRRYSGDAFQRTGQQERAEKEFAQLLVVSRQRNRNDDYYRILPRSRVYWRAVADSDQELADSVFEQIQADASTLPTSGALAVEAVIQWASILSQRGLLVEAKAAVDRMAVDNTVRSQQDQQHYAAWTAMTDSAAERGRKSVTPIGLLTTRRPIAVAVGAELARQNQWDAATAWVKRWDGVVVQTEVVSQIARQFTIETSSESGGAAWADSVSDLSVEIQQRVRAIRARISDELLQAAASELLSAELPSQRSMLTVTEILGYRTSDRTERQLDAGLLADLACSAASRNAVDVTARAIVAAYYRLCEDLPGTRSVREASKQLDASKTEVEATLRDALKRPQPDSITQEFRNYRRGLDRLAAATERRRLFLIALLCPVVEMDRGAGLAQAIEQDEMLRDELTLDPLCQLLAAEAVLAGGRIPVLAAVTENRIARGERVRLQPEIELAQVWFNLVQAAEKPAQHKLFADLDGVVILPGLRSCFRHRVVEAQAIRGDLGILDAASDIANEVDRETTLRTAALWLTRQGQSAAVERWLKGNSRLTPAASVQTMAGIISGLPQVEFITE